VLWGCRQKKAEFLFFMGQHNPTLTPAWSICQFVVARVAAVICGGPCGHRSSDAPTSRRLDRRILALACSTVKTGWSDSSELIEGLPSRSPCSLRRYNRRHEFTQYCSPIIHSLPPVCPQYMGGFGRFRPFIWCFFS
jgi:hypothetical protein